MVTYTWDLDRAVEQYGFKPIRITDKYPKYEIGKTYWCGYWSKWYKVIDAIYENKYHLKSVTVQWQDGKIGTHCTSLTPYRDWILLWEEDFNKTIIWDWNENDKSYTGDYIKTWCEYHKDNVSSKFKYLAEQFYDSYWGECSDKKYTPNPKVYYVVETGKDYKGLCFYKLSRDTEKSPRVNVAN